MPTSITEVDTRILALLLAKLSKTSFFSFSFIFPCRKPISKLGKIAFVENTLVLTSPRRFEAWGKTKAARKYIVTYLNYLLAGKEVPPSEYEPVR